MLFYAQGNKPVFQDHNAGKQQPDEMHNVLPAQAMFVPKILLQLLELREDVGIICSVDVARQENVPNIDQFPCQRRARFHQGRVQAFENIRVCLQPEADELLDFPVTLFVVAFELLRYSREGPMEIRGRQVKSASVHIRALQVESIGPGPYDASKHDERPQGGGIGSARNFTIGVLENREFLPAIAVFSTLRKTDKVGVFRFGRCLRDDAHAASGPRQNFGSDRDYEMGLARRFQIFLRIPARSGLCSKRMDAIFYGIMAL